MIKTQFKGTHVVPKNVTYLEIGELRGEFGREFLEEYNGRVEKDYGNADALRILRDSEGIVIRSNSFAVVLANSILPANLRTATQADLERVMQSGIDFRGTYEDTGLVLRSGDGCNEYLAKNLMKQLKARNQRIKTPQMINLTDLQLVKDANSPYGLRFRLTEGAKPIYAPILTTDSGSFSSEDIDLRTGLPKKLGNGNRILYTRKDGLSRLCLNWDASLGSGDGCLAGSGGSGRVRLASASQGAKPGQKFEAELVKAKASYISELEMLAKRVQEEIASLN